MKVSSFGKESGQPYYVYVGNQIMIDPTFLDNRTKKYFQEKNMHTSNKVYQKELILQELAKIQKQKYPEIESKRSGKLTFLNRKRPSTQLSFGNNQTFTQDGRKTATPRRSNETTSNKLAKNQINITRTNSSQRRLAAAAGECDSQRSSARGNASYNRPGTQIENRFSKSSNKIRTSPLMLKHRKKEILGIIKKSQDFMRRGTTTPTLDRDDINTSLRMNGTFIGNTEIKPSSNANQLNESVLVMSDVQQPQRKSGLVTFTTRKNQKKIVQPLFKNNNSFAQKKNMVLLTSGASTQASLLDNPTRFRSQYYDSFRKLNNYSTSTNQNYNRGQSPDLPNPFTHSQMTQFEQLKQQQQQQSRKQNMHKKSNSMFQQMQSNNASTNQQSQVNNGYNFQTQRQRDFDKSFQMLKMYADPYRIINQRSNGDAKSNKNIRKVNQDAVNWNNPL